MEKVIRKMKEYPYKRIFLIVADSAGIGEEPDAAAFDDVGSNTWVHAAESVGGLNVPFMEGLGVGELADIPGVKRVSDHQNAFSLRMREASNGKDTMTGHWEMMGVLTQKPFKTFTDTGFPKELMDELAKRTGHKLIGNVAASGTEILKVLGEEQMKENSLIIYTSADSVLQIAAHEETTGVQELYRCCAIARELCMDERYRVGRVIARPFVGPDKDHFKRTANRHDYALKPPIPTDMDVLKNNGFMTSCVGKINDIFDGAGVTKTVRTVSNMDGMDKTIEQVKNDDWMGLCFVNLVEFDSEYGHRRNPVGYARALEEFDVRVGEMMKIMREDDLLLITADHGNDPTFKGTDHTREKVPFLVYSPSIRNGRYLEERDSFADMGAMILSNFGLEKPSNLIGKNIPEILAK